MNFIQVFTIEDKEKLIKSGLHFIAEQDSGSGNKVYIFVNDKIKFNDSDVSKFRITNNLYFC